MNMTEPQVIIVSLDKPAEPNLTDIPAFPKDPLPVHGLTNETGVIE